MKTQKNPHMARRKMSHVIDEIYTSLLRAGSQTVSLTIRREKDGLALSAASDFDPERRKEMERMKELLTPSVRNPALVGEFWELAGDDQYTSDSELALVGQILDRAEIEVTDGRIEMELFILY